MARSTFTPQPHSVFNEFDQQGILLGLPRLSEERNPSYKWRLMDVFVRRASSAYLGLIYGITRELGLSLIETMSITPDPSFLLPAIVFEDTKCVLYSDYEAGTKVAEIDRFESDGGAYTLQELADTINATGLFTATILKNANSEDRSMTIFNQSSINQVDSEELSGKGARVKLDHEDLIAGTVSVSSANLIERVDSEIELTTAGRYYVDLEHGIILTTVTPEPGSTIRYKWRDKDFIAWSSPIIIHNLQSDGFKFKLFNQIDEETYGSPTHLGADIVNELLTVFPAGWGE
jgi:hypothetical protein